MVWKCLKYSTVFLISFYYILYGAYTNEKSQYVDAYLVYLEGLNFQNKNNSIEAIKKYKEAIKKHKQFPEPYYRIAQIYYLEKEYNYAKKYINLAKNYEEKFKEKTDYLLYLNLAAEIHYTLKDYSNALNFFEKYCELNKKIDCYYKIGEISYNQKKYEKAKENLVTYVSNIMSDINTHLSRNENFQNALKILVNIYMSEKEYGSALNFLKLLYIYFPTDEIKEKLSILSNNLRYYKNK